MKRFISFTLSAVAKCFILILIIFFITSLSQSCYRKEIDAINQELNDIRSRISALEVAKKAFEQKLFIMSVVRNQEGVYSITFSDGSTISIANGKDGKDGKDGANGTDGKDGKDGKDGENGKDGKDGLDGDTLIESIIIDSDKVTFLLTDGSTFSIPFYSAITLKIDNNEKKIILPQATIELPFSWVSNLPNVIVESLSSADIQSSVELNIEENKGILRLVFSETINEYSKVVLIASNGEKIAMETIHFEEAGIIISSGGEISFSASGGSEDVSFLTNIGFKVIIPEDCSWLKIESTKSYQEHSMTITASANESYDSRMVSVLIVDEETGSSVVSLLNIKQEGIEVLNATKNRDYIFSDGGIIELPVDCSVDYNIEKPDDVDWISIVQTKAIESNMIILQVDKNETGFYREAVIAIKGRQLKQEVLIGQFGDNNKVTIEHDDTGMTTPEIIYAGDLDDIALVNWGDGSSDLYQAGITHDYKEGATNGNTEIYFKELPESIFFKNIKGINHIDLSKL